MEEKEEQQHENKTIEYEVYNFRIFFVSLFFLLFPFLTDLFHI